VAAEHGTRLDALLTDVVMPRMGGPETARLLRKEHPGLRVLFVSGYSDSDPLEEGWERAAFLQKPFTLTACVRALRSLLDSGTVPAG